MSTGVRPLEPPDDGSQAGLRPIAVGVDLADVRRLAHLLARRGADLADRVSTPAEHDGCADDVQGLDRWELSLPHDQTHAVAVAVAAGSGDPR